MAEKLANKPQKLNKKAKGVRPSLFSVLLKMKNFYSSGSLQTSIHSSAFEYLKSSSRLSSIALLPLPTAGNTV